MAVLSNNLDQQLVRDDILNSYIFILHSFDLRPNSETQKHFQTWHPPVWLSAHIKKYNKHGCQILLNFAIKSENKPLLSKWTAN